MVSITNNIINEFTRINSNGGTCPWYSHSIINQITHENVQVPNVESDDNVLFQVKFKDESFSIMRNPSSNIGLHGNSYMNESLLQQTRGRLDCYPQAISWLIQNIYGTKITNEQIAHDFGKYASNRNQDKCQTQLQHLSCYFPSYIFSDDREYIDIINEKDKLFERLHEIQNGYATLIVYYYNDRTAHTNIIYRDNDNSFGIFDRQSVNTRRIKYILSGIYKEDQFYDIVLLNRGNIEPPGRRCTHVGFYRVSLVRYYFNNTQSQVLKNIKEEIIIIKK